MVKGIPASPGISMGKAFVYKDINNDILEVKINDAACEKQRFKEAIDKARNQLLSIKEAAKSKVKSSEVSIFDAHILMLEDPEFISSVESYIDRGTNAEYGVKSTVDSFVSIFEAMENKYFRERAADIKDVGKRVVNILSGIENFDFQGLEEECIIVAKDLAPSDIAQMDRKKVKGLAADVGGKTSHMAIIAASMEIPAVLGLGNITEKVKSGDTIIVDGYKGVVIVNPDDNTKSEYEEKIKQDIKLKEELIILKDMEAVTIDGIKVELGGNIGNPNDADGVIKNGGDGIGLFRTEFLFMDKDSLPSEDEQFSSYKEVLEKMGNRPVIIRTMDIGGDKKLSYLPMDEEMNPFLGYRAIRMCLDRKDIFKTQLRALYRASLYGNLRIMFPMVSNLEEIREIKSVIDDVKNELDRDCVEYGNPKIGIMIEVPSAAIISDILAREVDFFSIGTNDLIQYTAAVDRMNEKVSYLYDPFHPGVLRLIKLVIDNAHREGKWAGICGEMAGNADAIPLLVGMGIDELSMTPSLILKAKKLVRSSNYRILKELADKSLKLGSSDEIRKFIEKYKTI